jgi:hypothetical protein
MERISSAAEFLHNLKEKGRLPGWSKNDKGAIDLEAYSKSVTFNIRKQGISSSYHYAVTRVSNEGTWKLQKAWRTDRQGRTIEEYPVR